MSRKVLARRNFLARFGGAAVAYWLGSLVPRPLVAHLPAETVRTVSGSVNWPKGMTIPAGRRVRFDPNVSTTVTVSGGNVIVEGVLEMRPAAPDVVHTLRFTNVSEAAFVGGGDDVLASDRGLWVMGAGVLDVQGTPKTPWARVAQAISVGQTTILLDRNPVGWQVGDEVAITPTEPPSVKNHWNRYETRRVAGISGRQITLDGGCIFPHPIVTIPASENTGFPGASYGAEVLNLTRDVRIEGTSGGRSHIFIRSSKPQALSSVAIRYMGPRQPTGETAKGRDITGKVLGRYPLHFHHCRHDSRGSRVESVVVWDCGSHAFVAHASHGVTFEGCISHNTFETPYWWDPNVSAHDRSNNSDHIAYLNCVASLVFFDPDFRGARLTAFVLGNGDHCSIRDSVAVGVGGTKDSSGFNWPEVHGAGSWDFRDNLAHNNFRHGIHTWQNNSEVHDIFRFTAYHNGWAGIAHGAYSNTYHYEDSVLYRNGGMGIELHATSTGDTTRGSDGFLRFTRILCDGNPVGLQTARHAADQKTPTIVSGCHFRDQAAAALGFTTGGDIREFNGRERFDVTSCLFGGKPFWLADTIKPESLIQVRDARGSVTGSFALRRKDQPGGALVPAWNAKRYDVT